MDSQYGGLVAIIYIALYLLTAWGLYMTSKKLGEEYSWMAFIPYLNIYTIVKAGGKPGIWVLWIILGFILVIPGLILWIMVLNGISKRTLRGTGTTIGLLFVPFIMFPIVGHNLQSVNGSEAKSSEKTEL